MQRMGEQAAGQIGGKRQVGAGAEQEQLPAEPERRARIGEWQQKRTIELH